MTYTTLNGSMVETLIAPQECGLKEMIESSCD